MNWMAFASTFAGGFIGSFVGYSAARWLLGKIYD